MACIRKALPIVLAGLAFAAQQPASACYDRTFCLKWQPMLIDEGFGDVYTVPGHAYGARVTLIRPPPEPPLSTFLDENGCMTFKTQFAFGHKVVVYSEARVGTPPQWIKAVRQEVYNGASEPRTWIVDLHGIAADDVMTHTIVDQATDPLASIMAVTTLIMVRFGNLGVIPLEPQTPDHKPNLEVLFRDYKAGADGTYDGIGLGPDSYNKKFVIAHEMGHWLKCEWGGNFPPETKDYSYGDAPNPPPNPPCRFGGVEAFDLNGKEIVTSANQHGIRSAEWSTSAAKEGFAHFIAAATFNEVDIPDGDGVFRYYKAIDTEMFPEYADLKAASYRISLLGGTALESPLGGENRWTENRCPDDWAVDEVSTELDWLRFFWRFLTKGVDNKPTLSDVLEFFAYAKETGSALWPINGTNVWPQLELIMDDSPGFFQFLPRFQEANEVMGVYNDDTGA
jgi:hypothetical protein